MKLDWNKLHFGKLTRNEIQSYVSDSTWQRVRKSLVGEQLSVKYEKLQLWLMINHYNRASQVQVTNYVTALSRGGLIKPEDYKEAYQK